MRVTNDKSREIAAKVRETMGELGQVELDGIPLADLIEPEECDGCEPGAWEVVAMEVAERLGVAVGGCLPSDYADAIGEALDRRLMPEGMEWLLKVWPKWSNGEYCKFGDLWKSDKYGKTEPQQLRKLSIYMPEHLREWGQDDGDHFGYEWDFVRLSDPTYRPDKAEPPAPKVLDAEGEEISVGDEVWLSDKGRERYLCINGEPMVVTGFSNVGNVNVIDQEDVKLGQDDPWIISSDMLTHQCPTPQALDADDVETRVGDKVWSTSGAFDGARTVSRVIYDDDEMPPYAMFEERREPWSCLCCCLTHERPDSWERLEEDARQLDIDLNDTTDGYPRMSFCRDLVRRAKALAERGK